MPPTGFHGRPRGFSRASFGAELPALLRLAGPVVVAELGWMTMGLVDTIMVGPLGPEAIGAVGLGSTLFMAVAIFGMGILLGLDTLVSHAHGAGEPDTCRRWLVHGLVLGAMLTPPLTAVLWLIDVRMDVARLHPAVEALARPYLAAVTWSMAPLLAYAATRRYLQGIGLVRPIMFALVTANLVNVAANWILIYGHLGLPAMGVRGAAVATVLSRAYMLAVLASAIVFHDRWPALVAAARAGIQRRRLARLLSLGVPAATQITLEVGVFAAASALAGRLDPVALASHQIALNIVSFLFMVPLGVASSGAVRVGHAVGRRDAEGAGRAGWSAIAVILVFMSLSAIVLISVPRLLISPFSTEASVLQLGARLLAVAALFQLFDGLQVVATGILRGLGDTRTPVVWNVIGHWGLGLPIAWWLCFPMGWGVVGLWVGLATGLTLCGIILVGVWHRRTWALAFPSPRASLTVTRARPVTRALPRRARRHPGGAWACGRVCARNRGSAHK